MLNENTLLLARRERITGNKNSQQINFPQDRLITVGRTKVNKFV